MDFCASIIWPEKKPQASVSYAKINDGWLLLENVIVFNWFFLHVLGQRLTLY